MNLTIDMERIPNNYGNSQAEEKTIPTVIDDTEFAQYLAGKTDTISPDVRKKLKLAMKDADVKLNIFFMAYAQKNVSRLARIMSALDTADKELFQDWRIRSMDNEDLLDLVSELGDQKYKTHKELMEISGKLSGNIPSVPEEENGEHKLNRNSRRKVAEFFKKKIVKD